MKKFFVTIAAALLGFAACQDQFIPQVESFEHDVLDYPLVKKFTAVSESGTKTTLDGTHVLWEANDAIKVLWGENKSNKAYAVPGEGNASAVFTTKVEPAETYYAAYPWSASTVLDEGKLVVEIPSVQTGAFKDANFTVAKADADNNFAFKHIVGILEFTINAAGVVVISGAPADVLTGTVSVSGFDAQTGLPQYEVVDGANTITIDVPAAGTYYAAFIPSAKLNCLSVKVGEGEATQYAISANTIQMQRGKIVTIGNIDTQFGKNIFVTPSGTKDEEGNDIGDGKTWETALSYKQMYMMISESGSEDPKGDSAPDNQNTERAAAVDGKIFRLAGGEYDAGNYVRIDYSGRGTAVKMDIMGGYDPQSTGTDLSKRTSETKILGGESSYRHFYVEHYLDLTFDGITFTQGKTPSTSDGGGSILYRNTEGSTLTLRNCIFDGNTSACTGGAIYHDSGNLRLYDCTLKDNTATVQAGAIYSKAGNLDIDGCMIDNNDSENSGSSKYGGAFYFSTAGVFNISNSTIRNCNAKTYGGGIYLTSDGSVLNIYNTMFENNQGKTRGGAICLSGGSLCTINQCSFTGNYADKWGGALATTTSTQTATYLINNSVFTGNYCSSDNRNGNAIFVRGGNLGMNNCSVYDNIGSGQSSADYSSDLRFIITNETGAVIINSTIISADGSTTASCISDANTDNVTGNGYTPVTTSKIVMMNNAFACAGENAVQTTSYTEGNYFESKGYDYTTNVPSQFVKVGENPWFTSSALVAGVKVSDISTMLKSDVFSSLTGKPTLGTDFLTWLDGLTVRAGNGTAKGALGYDIAGNSRGEAAYTPGCYQGN